MAVRDYERYEPVRPAPPPDVPMRPTRPSRKPRKPARVNPLMLAMGDDLVLLGAFLRILGRRKLKR